MSQVHIASNAHTVTVNHDTTDLSYLIEKAQKLWDDTKPPDAGNGPAYGFSMQRDPGPQLGRNKRWGGDFEPVRADGPPAAEVAQ